MSSLEGLELVTVSPLRQDPGWKHCQVFVKNDENSNGVNRIEVKKCLYCGKMFQGGGIHRVKEHLAGRKGNGPICDEAPEEVRIAMQQCLDNGVAVKRQKKNLGLVNLSSSLGELGQCNSNGVRGSNLSGNQGDLGANCVSVVKDELGDDPVAIPIGAGYVSVCEAQLGSAGSSDAKFLLREEEGMGNRTVERRHRLRDANPGSEPSDSPAAILRENVDLLGERAEHRAIPSINSSVLVSREEEHGVGNASVSKRKRVIDDNFYAGEEDGVVSNGLGLEGVDNQQIQIAIGRFLYEIGVPLEAVKESVYFQPMINAIASGGSEVFAPSYHDLRGRILKDVAGKVRNDVDQCKTRWAKIGCSLLASQWNTRKGRTFLNFSVYYPEQTVFLKSVDISSIIYSPDALHDLFRQVVEEVGVQHVLQVITSSEEKYIVVGKRLMQSFPSLYWSPCAAHCIELMLMDFGEIEWIKSAIEQARSVTRFIYKHAVVLNIMRRYTFGIDIVRPGESLFATNFMTLKQMADLKLNLQSMVTSQEWMGSSYSNTEEGLVLLHTLTNRSFWSSCILITRLTDPLLRVLSIVGSQRRAAMGYIFAGIYRVKETIKRELPRREDYMVYWNIIDHRWKKLWHLPLHTAGFYLNPKFFYSTEGDMHNSVVSGVFDCIERLVSDIEVQDRIAKEITLYKDAVGDLGRNLAIRARDTLFPAEWWSTYGGGCPFLARFAVRILSQTCSLVHHKPNYTSFEQLHETRNCLEQQRLNDLIFVQNNLQLRQLSHRTKVQEYEDPLSSDRKGVVEDWVMEKEVNLQDNGSANWQALDPPSVNSMLLELSTDEAEDLRTGFDDDEIFNALKEVKEE